jgi:hypothetical protein
VSSLVAFGFLHGSLLWGLGLAGIPVIIHLLSRRRYKRVRWAAQRWLLAALKKSARRILLEQLLLLAVRTLLIAVVVLAVARPYTQGHALVVLPTQRTHRLVLLDASLSMAARPAGRSRFERALDVARHVVQQSRPGDALSVILVSRPPRVVVPGPSASAESVLSELEELHVTHAAADWSGAFVLAGQLLAASGLQARELYVLTDLQRTSWVSQPVAAETLAQLGRDTRIILVDLGSSVSLSNVAVTAVNLSEPFAVTSMPLTVLATVKNFGPSPVASLGVELRLQGRRVERKAIDLEPGAAREVTFRIMLTEPGPQVLEVWCDEDFLSPDNARWLALEGREAIRVLCVDGETGTGAFDSETDYLRVALSPGADFRDAGTPYHVETVPESALLETALQDYQLLFLCNIGQLTASEVRVLEEYLRAGGALAIFLGDQIRADLYNNALWRDGKGCLPARIMNRIGDPAGKTFVTHFDAGDYAHPIVKPFQGTAPQTLVSTMIYAYYRVEPSPSEAVRVALKYDTGDPAILTSTWHRGRVALVTTSADTEWTTWPVWPSYVPLIQELARYLAGRAFEHWNLAVGEPLALEAGPSAAQVRVTVQVPDGRQLARVWDTTSGPFQFSPTELAGPYRVTVADPIGRPYLFACNPPLEESDLVRLDPQELERVLPGVRLEYVQDGLERPRGEPPATAATGQWHRPLLYLALMLLGTELVLAWRLNRPH